MEFDIAKRTNYLVVSGSYAYGTFSSTSDYDLRGWGIPPTEYFLTFDKHFEQSDQTFKFKEYPFAKELQQYVTKNSYRRPEQDEEIDHCIYDIRKFFALAAECNPNIIELLFVDENEILICDENGKRVREARDLFLSARAKHTFTGYAVSQLKRINSHRKFLMHPPKEKPTREQFGLPATGLIPAEQRGAAEALVNAQIRDWLGYDSQLDKTELSIFRENLTDFLSHVLSSKELIIQFKDELEMTRAARLAAMEKIGMDKNYIVVLQKEKEYRDKLTEWTQYQTWVANRNPERAALETKYLYDVKHGSHLIRLLLQGKDLLTTGKITIKRPEVQQMMCDVKAGAWSYEKLISFMKETDNELQDIYDNKKYVVPHKPKMKELSKLCESIVRQQVAHEE